MSDEPLVWETIRRSDRVPGDHAPRAYTRRTFVDGKVVYADPIFGRFRTCIPFTQQWFVLALDLHTLRVVRRVYGRIPPHYMDDGARECVRRALTAKEEGI